MNPQLEPLIRLQGVDLRSAAIRDQRRKFPDRLKAAEQPLLEAKATRDRTKAAADTAAKTRRDREQELESQEGQIAKMKARASEIKKNVEYQAHLFEIQMADKKKGEIEEQILVLMDEVEQQQKAVKEAEQRVAQAEQTFAAQKAELETLDAKLAEELGGLERKREEIAASVDPALMERYNKLKRTHKELALAPIRGGICSGCRLQIQPQLVAEVKRAEKLLSCNYCQRILYWEEEAGAVPAAAEKLHEQV